MNVKPSSGAAVLVAFALVYLIWGSTYLAIRFVIETMPTFLSAGVRFFLAGVFLYAWMLLKDKTLKPSLRQWRSAAVIGGLMILGGNGAVVWAEHYVPSGTASLFIATVPLWMVLLEWLWLKGARPSGMIFAGILTGFAGVALLMLPGLSHARPSVAPGEYLAGAGMLLFASVSWSIGSVYSRKADLPASPFAATAMQMMCGGLILVLFGSISGEWSTLDVSAFSLKSVLSFVYLLIFGSLVGFTSYIWLLKNAGPTKTSTYAFVNPVVAIILGALLAGEPVTPLMLAASVLIITAVVVMIWFNNGRGHS